jgi:Flp pilus assembly protein TadG
MGGTVKAERAIRRPGWRSGWRSRRGASVLEFAMIAPVVILLSIATIEFGYILTVQNLLELSARKASRTGLTGKNLYAK